MSGRKSVVYIINSLEIGGAEVGMYRLLNGLDSEEYDVTVAVLDGRSDDIIHQIPSWVNVISLYSPTQSLPRSVSEFFRAIGDAEIIVGSLFHSVMIAKLAGIMNRGATVVTWRHNTSFKTKKRKIAFNVTTRLTDVVLTDSDPVKEQLISETRTDESNVHTVPIAGLDLSKYEKSTHEERDTPVVGTVGRLIEQKNHTTILDVAERLQGTGITFEIAGDGELYDHLEEEIRERELANVTLLGFVDDLPEFLASLDIYFQPSHHEGLCITVLEAMATGLPVVGSDVGGIGQTVDHSESGFLYEPRDVAGFASAIETLASDPQLRERFGERGRETVQNGFTQGILVSEFKEAIRGRV